MRKRYSMRVLAADSAHPIAAGLALAGIGSDGPTVKTRGGEIFTKKLGPVAVLALALIATASASASNRPQVVSVLSVSGPILTDPPDLFSRNTPPPVGARLFFHDTLYAWAGKKRGDRIGHTVGVCTLTGFTGTALTSSCAETIFLPAGQILIAGSPLIKDGPMNVVIAVVGGTGRYSDARGWVRIRDLRTPEKSSLVFHLAP